MPARKKITKRVKIELSGAQEKFVFGHTDKHVNPFEELDIEYPIHPKSKAKFEELLKLQEQAKIDGKYREVIYET